MYQPPEVCPTRNDIEVVKTQSKSKEKSHSHSPQEQHARPQHNEAQYAEGSEGIQEVTSRIHNRYDVWSLACIMLEVIKYIKEGGPEAITRFQDERNKNGEGIAFHDSKGGAAAKLKSSVHDAMSVYKMQTSGGGHVGAANAYLRGVISLLFMMLRTLPEYRLSSQEVIDELEELSKAYKRDVAPEDENASELRGRLSGPYREILRETRSGHKSFIEMYAHPLSKSVCVMR